MDDALEFELADIPFLSFAVLWAQSLMPAFQAGGLEVSCIEPDHSEDDPGMAMVVKQVPVEAILRVRGSGLGEMEINDNGLVSVESFDDLFDPAQMMRLLSRFAEYAMQLIVMRDRPEERPQRSLVE